MTRTQDSPQAPILKRIARVAVTEGLRGLRNRMVQQWCKRFRFVYGYMLLLPLAPDMPVPAARADLRLETVLPEDDAAIRAVARLYGAEDAVDDIHRRLVDGELLYTGRIDGEIIATLWLQLAGDISEFQKVMLALKPGEVYCRDVYVDPSQRGKNIYPAMKALSGRQVAQAYGKTRLIDWVRWKNAPSLSASRKLGELRIGKIGYVMIFGRKFRFLFWHRPRLL